MWLLHSKLILFKKCLLTFKHKASGILRFSCSFFLYVICRCTFFYRDMSFNCIRHLIIRYPDNCSRWGRTWETYGALLIYFHPKFKGPFRGLERIKDKIGRHEVFCSILSNMLTWKIYSHSSSWCNGYRRWKWKRWTEFKPWRGCFQSLYISI